MQQDYIRCNCNFLVKEAHNNFTKLNKIMRARVNSIEEKTLVTIELNKLNADQIKAKLKETLKG